MPRLTLLRGWHVYHKPKSWHYLTSNSIAGIRRAKAKRYRGIDLDLSMDADGLAWCNHWPKLMLHEIIRDPRRAIVRSTSISRMSSATVRRLRPSVLSLSAALLECKRQNITACLEIKGDRRFNRDYFDRLHTWCRKHGVAPIIMTLPQGGHGIEIMRDAKAAGFRTMWLWRGSIPESYYAHLTYVKKGNNVYRVDR